MTNRYNAYGLTIHSEIAMPELILQPNYNGVEERENRQNIIHIRLGTAPEQLDNPVKQGILYQASANRFLLCMDHIARYLVQNGNEIIIQPAPDASESDIRVFLLGSVFGALLHQRELLVLHASAIGTDKGAVLFTGPSGIGKSTLLGALLNRGYHMMVDDVCAVELDGAGQPIVLPAYPRTRLWADSARRLNVETEQLDRTRPSLEKYERQMPEQFWDKPAPLRHIYRLIPTNQDELKLVPLPRIQTFSSVLQNTYRDTFLDGLEMRQPHFKLVSAVAAHAGVTRARRPSGRFKIAELADFIEADMAVDFSADFAANKVDVDEGEKVEVSTEEQPNP